MAAGRVVGKEFREDSAAAASSAAANAALSGSGSGYANPLAAAASQGGSLASAIGGRKQQSADVLQLRDGQTVTVLPAHAHSTLHGRPHTRGVDVDHLQLVAVPDGFGRDEENTNNPYRHLLPASFVQTTVLAGPRAAARASSSSSSSSSSSAAAAASSAAAPGGMQSLPDPSSIRDPYNYVQRRGVPPKKDRTWGGDVMYYPGVSYLYGLGGGCVYGLVTVPATAGLPLKLRFNSWINAMGRHGSRMANGFGCTAVFYATYKHLVQSVRGDKIDQWNSIAGAGLAVSTFFVPKGKTYMAAGGVAAATAMAAVEFGLQHPTVQQYQRRTYNAWKRTALYKNLFGDK